MRRGRNGALPAILLAFLPLVSVPGCRPPEAPAPAPATPALSLFQNRVWKVRASSSVAPDTLYVFLSEGTLVVTSPHSRPALGRWTYERDTLTMIEEGIAYRAEILSLRDDEFRIRSHNPGTPVDITLVPAAQ